ncbi:MAG: ABC transporter substrate-binding protein [Opitutus sp.]|nr:ABC transporter substrate-binding protein [Opitutus sp.]
MLQRALILAALVGIVALPFVLRPSHRAEGGRTDDTLVIITPHNEAIRHEFARGFAQWYRERTGRTVAIDWRVIGGTSEISRFLESEYVASFRLLWTGRMKRPWSLEVQAGFANARLSADAPAEAREAREVFLASDVSCGIDLFFGGGSYDFIQQAEAGRLVPTRVVENHPDWFRPDVMPAVFAGEPFRDSQSRWIGNVLSSYGILYNRDALTRLGIENEPMHWSDLADPRLVGQVALSDPTKSSSIAKAFENLIQQQMQIRLAALRRELPGASVEVLERRAVAEGWIAGLQLLQRIGANARYFTDSSQKPPIDVAQGDCAAGICIDFYGRSQAEVAALRSKSRPRLGFISPPGGTVSSVDPIAILRGAPHREVAEACIEFTLSPEGQKLWNLRPGTPGGPERFALRRLPVRRDFYKDAAVDALRSDPGVNPYAEGEALVYRPTWTAGVFREMAFIIRVMALDCHGELVDAWRALDRAGMPADALAVMQDLSLVSYDRVNEVIRPRLRAKNKVEELKLARELGDAFRANYREAKRMAEQRGAVAVNR